MPLYIAQSGDLDRCYRCLTDSQRKDRATQLLIKYKSGALVTQYPKSLKEISRVLKIHYACLDGQLAIWFDFQERKKWFPLENKVNYEMNHSWSIYLSFKTFPKSALTAWKVILPDEMFRASIELKKTWTPFFKHVACLQCFQNSFDCYCLQCTRAIFF